MLPARRTAEADAARAATNDSLCALLVANAAAYSSPVAPPRQPLRPPTIEVACRCRPLLPREVALVGTTITGGITHVPEFPNCTVLEPEVHVHSEKRRVGIPDPAGKLETKKFRLHAAFGPERGEDAIYARLVKPLVAVAQDGGRAACIAYGQTGSGKTFSMSNQMQLAVDDLFDRDDLDTVPFSVSFFELRGEACFDLLADRKELIIRQNAEGESVIVDLSKSTVGSAAELRKEMERGSQLRRTAETQGNAQSSRSHAFCDITQGEGVLRFVDLAGSERRADAVDHDMERIKEMKEINSSLGNLKECIRLLLANNKSKKKQHIPYRRSKLTRLLREELGGGEGDGAATTVVRTAFLVHVSPTRSSLLHTLNTLSYAEAMIAATRADSRRKAFRGTDAWGPEKVSAWVRELDGGKYAELADSFHLSGKMFGAAWINDILRRVEVAGGTEEDGNAIYDAFHKMRLELKKKGSAVAPRRTLGDATDKKMANLSVKETVEDND